MPIVDMRGLLDHAYQNRYAVGCFSVTTLESVINTIHAAEESSAPVVLSLSQSPTLELLATAVERAAEQATVPVAIHFDHATTLEQAIGAIRLGCNSLTVSNSEAENTPTHSIAEMAHACGVPIAATLQDHSVEAIEAQNKQNQKEIAIDFLQLTPADLERDRQQSINQRLKIPLIADADALTEETCPSTIGNGLSMILQRASIKPVETQIKQWGGAGKAAEALQHTTLWAPVEHLIIFNADATTEAAHEMMNRGQKMLAAIPGVRRVFTGEAIQEGAQYRFSWVIRFCHPAVIDSYRDHPDHVAFADTLFRPVAGNRISIDYQAV